MRSLRHSLTPSPLTRLTQRDVLGQRTWPHADALGTPRLLRTAAGVVLDAPRSDAWGRPQNGTQPTPFGFTGELQSATDELVYLRARWYNPVSGAFLSRDPFAGYVEMPYSLHPYQYAYAAPTTWVDPRGEAVCEGYAVDPHHAPYAPPSGYCPDGTPIPYEPSAPTRPSDRIDIGYIIGASFNFASGGFQAVPLGVEVVIDFYDFEIGIFRYFGVGAGVSGCSIFRENVILATGSINAYAGYMWGWKGRDRPGVHNYAGIGYAYSAGVSMSGPISAGISLVHSADMSMWGFVGSVSLGTDKLPFGGSFLETHYAPPFQVYRYHGQDAMGNPQPPTLEQSLSFLNVINALALMTQGPMALSTTLNAGAVIAYNATVWNMEATWRRSLPGSTIHHQ